MNHYRMRAWGAPCSITVLALLVCAMGLAFTPAAHAKDLIIRSSDSADLVRFKDSGDVVIRTDEATLVYDDGDTGCGTAASFKTYKLAASTAVFEVKNSSGEIIAIVGESSNGYARVWVEKGYEEAATLPASTTPAFRALDSSETYGACIHDDSGSGGKLELTGEVKRGCVWYVTTSGSDSNCGGSWLKPVRGGQEVKRGPV